MTLNSLLSIAILLALIFEHFEVVFCPRGPNGWGKFGYGNRGSDSLEAYEQKSKPKVPRPPKNRQSTSFTFPDDTAAVDEMASGFAELNVLANMATHISLKDYAKIREFIRMAAKHDLCKCGVAGLFKGNRNCLKAFTQFQRVPKDMRGDNCRGAHLARCYKPEGSNDIPVCSFFIKTSLGHVRPANGIWKPLTVCAQDLDDPPTTGMPGVNWILERK